MNILNKYKSTILLFVLSSLWALHFSLVKLVEADNNLNNQTINNVKTGTLETIKTKIPESIFGATKNSTYNGIT